MTKKTILPTRPDESIERLILEAMKTAGKAPAQFACDEAPSDYDDSGNYQPLPLIAHVWAVVTWLGGDLADRLDDCIRTSEMAEFQPKMWQSDEPSATPINKAAE
jgi:hypothetical protein